jgi:hypothetical protein
MSDPTTKARAAIALPSDFVFGEVRPATKTSGPSPAPPSLGPLASFVGSWAGSGFNTIFRPDNPETPTAPTLPIPVATLDNILELNLTSESLTFSPSLGSVPNRGSNSQGDIHLNGVPYLQTISDVTTGPKIGIHVEPGLWMFVPETNAPAEGVTFTVALAVGGTGGLQVYLETLLEGNTQNIPEGPAVLSTSLLSTPITQVAWDLNNLYAFNGQQLFVFYSTTMAFPGSVPNALSTGAPFAISGSNMVVVPMSVQ